MDSKSPHILSTSANLMGLCFVVYSMLKSSGVAAHSIADEVTVLGAFFFSVSCLLSFLAMKNKKQHGKDRLELIADYAFLIGLYIIFFLVVLTVLGFVQ